MSMIEPWCDRNNFITIRFDGVTIDVTLSVISFSQGGFCAVACGKNVNLLHNIVLLFKYRKIPNIAPLPEYTPSHSVTQINPPNTSRGGL